MNVLQPGQYGSVRGVPKTILGELSTKEQCGGGRGSGGGFSPT